MSTEQKIRDDSAPEGCRYEWRNWAYNFVCHPRSFLRPSSTQDVARLVSAAVAAKRNIRVVGCGHSPNASTLTNDMLISLERMRSVVSVHRMRAGEIKCEPNNEVRLYNPSRSFAARSLPLPPRTAGILTVQGGLQLRDIVAYLRQYNLAIQNLGTIAVQTVAGAISTGTHGSGVTFRTLASMVLAIQFVDGTGKIRRCVRPGYQQVLHDKGVIDASVEADPDVFRSLSCSLGALGIITEVTLKCVPLYYLREKQTHVSWSRFESFWKPHNLRFPNVKVPNCLAYRSDHNRAWWFPYNDVVVIYDLKRELPCSEEDSMRAIGSEAKVSPQSGGEPVRSRTLAEVEPGVSRSKGPLDPQGLYALYKYASLTQSARGREKLKNDLKSPFSLAINDLYSQEVAVMYLFVIAYAITGSTTPSQSNNGGFLSEFIAQSEEDTGRDAPYNLSGQEDSVFTIQLQTPESPIPTGSRGWEKSQLRPAVTKLLRLWFDVWVSTWGDQARVLQHADGFSERENGVIADFDEGEGLVEARKVRRDQCEAKMTTLSLVRILNFMYYYYQVSRHQPKALLYTDVFLVRCPSQYGCEWCVDGGVSLPALREIRRTLLQQTNCPANFLVELRWVRKWVDEDGYDGSGGLIHMCTQGMDRVVSVPNRDGTLVASPCDYYVFIGFVVLRPFHNVPLPHMQLYSAVQQVFVKYGGRPHWGKFHTLNQKQFQQAYGQNMRRFQAVRSRMDPHGVFVNPWTERVLGPVQSAKRSRL